MTEGNPLQRTAEWLRDRTGCLTASRFADVVARKRDGTPTKAYYELIDTIIAERVTGDSIGTTAAMQWGIDHEDEARAEYEAQTAPSSSSSVSSRTRPSSGSALRPTGSSETTGLSRSSARTASSSTSSASRQRWSLKNTDRRCSFSSSARAASGWTSWTTILVSSAVLTSDSPFGRSATNPRRKNEEDRIGRHRFGRLCLHERRRPWRQRL